MENIKNMEKTKKDSWKNYWKEINGEIISRSSGGVDWSANRKVIARNMDSSKYIFWRPGCKVWGDIISGYIYTGGILIAMSDEFSSVRGILGKDLSKDGGRLFDHLRNKEIRESIADVFHISERNLPVFKLGKTYVFGLFRETLFIGSVK